jgi:LysR family transcriptional regulator, transcriptional activator of the cysJI operon
VIENFKLRVFRVVADSLNLGRAAEELQLPQPAITSQIKTLDQTDWKSEKALLPGS